MIIIPFLNGYFIGNIPYFQTNPSRPHEKWATIALPWDSLIHLAFPWLLSSFYLLQSTVPAPDSGLKTNNARMDVICKWHGPPAPSWRERWWLDCLTHVEIHPFFSHGTTGKTGDEKASKLGFHLVSVSRSRQYMPNKCHRRNPSLVQALWCPVMDSILCSGDLLYGLLYGNGFMVIPYYIKLYT